MSHTFLDSGVYIAAAAGEEPDGGDARQLLADSGRLFVSSRLVELEVLPAPPGRHHAAQELARASYFASVGEWVAVDAALVSEAAALRRTTPGLGAMDALHAAAAIRAQAELVTLESPSKPLYRVPGLSVLHVSAAAKRAGK